MNAHALAQLLLAGPDLPVVTVMYDGSGTELEAVNGIEPDTETGSLLLVEETLEQARVRWRKEDERMRPIREARLAEDTRNRIRAEELRRTAQAQEPADF